MAVEVSRRSGLALAAKRLRMQTKVSRYRSMIIASIVFVLTVLGIRLWAYINRYAVNVMFWDQWDFLSGFFEDATAWRIFFWQHGPHRQGLGGLLIKAIYVLTDWDDRAHAFACGTMMAASTLLALSIRRRVLSNFSIFDVCIPLLFLTTLADLYVVTPNLAHGPTPLFLILAFVLALDLRQIYLRLPLALALNWFTIYTGFGIYLGFIAPIVFASMLWNAIRQRQHIALHATAVVVSALSLLSFFHHYVFQPAVECFRFPHDHPSDYLYFLMLLFGRSFGLLHLGGPRTVIGALALFLCIILAVTSLVCFLRTRGALPLWRTLFILSAFTLVFALNVDVGRVCLGVETANASRYVPYVLPIAFAAYLYVSSLKTQTWIRNTALCIFFVICVNNQLASAERGQVRYFSGGKARWRACYLRERNIEVCDQATAFRIYPVPTATHLKEKLDYLEIHRLNLFKP